MDRSWYLRFALMVGLTIVSALVLWPSFDRWVPCPSFVKTTFPRRLSPGLDIRGGLRLAYEVEVDEAIRDRRDRLADSILEQLGRDLHVLTEEGVPSREALGRVRQRVEVHREGAKRIRVKFHRPREISRIDHTFMLRFDQLREIDRTADEVVLEMREDRLANLRDTAVQQAVETISNRIDELQIRETSVESRNEEVIIEIPGADSAMFERTRDLISRTARLAFQIVDDDADFVQRVGGEHLPEGLHLERETVSAGPRTTTAFYVKATGRSARANLRRWVESVRAQVPEDHQLTVGEMDDEDVGGQSTNAQRKPHAWRTWYLFGRAEVTGDSIQDANVAIDTRDGSPYVSLTFNNSGADTFERLTGANVKRRMAIVLDNVVKSAPVIQNRIPGGRCQITLGQRDYNALQLEAKDLVVVLRAGALPAPIRPANEQMIGPSIGADAIQQGIIAATVGTTLALLFMLVYYAVGGIVADVMVLLNIFFLMAVMAALEATISLPGIAGIALTVGMSLDANVLINERIREEQRAGKSPRAAVDAGFDRAFWSVMDSQLTTLIAGIVLFQYGTGPIKGFATTLMIGIITSIYTGVFCSRVAFEWLVRGLKLSRVNVG